MKKNFIKACYFEEVAHIPVWMMRQAGRYLASYRKIKEKYDFQTMYKTPEIASEVTLLPLKRFPVDAAILFSDILVIPEAMGLKLKFEESKGPIFEDPIRSLHDIYALKEPPAEESLKYVFETIQITKKEINKDQVLIGFTGAPWTLACYMVEGGTSQDFKHIKKMRYQASDTLKLLLEKISKMVIDYSREQIRMGAEVIQLFDTWAGILDEDAFVWLVIPCLKKIITAIKTENVPIIYFSKGTSSWLSHLKSIGADVISIDWQITLSNAKKILDGRAALQGNLDPMALYCPPDQIHTLVKEMINAHGKKTGYIANLGHGIPPDVPPENAEAFINAVLEEGTF